MRKLFVSLGSGVLLFFLLGINPVKGQSITCTSDGHCYPGNKVTITFSSFPDALVERLEACKEQHEDMFASFEILNEEHAIRVEVAYDDFREAELNAWMDSWLTKWNDEIHEDMVEQ